ncbi:MAG: RelA/SpoT domain-containing protein [Bacteroidota bacterium]
MNKTDKIIHQFNSDRLYLEEFRLKLEDLITILLKNNGIRYHQIASRIKDENNLRNKIETKNGKYTQLSDITDIIGLRIITYFEDEVDKVAKIISKEFKVDPENSVDKRIIDPDRFGYQSLHFIVKVQHPRSSLNEWKRFTDFNAEIQIRSILMHAWAEISHDIGYKGEISIPKQERRAFFRIAALLELADKEFIRLKENLTKYEQEVTKLIEISPEDVLLDKASLLSYLKTSNTLKEIEEIMANIAEAKIVELYDDIDMEIHRINYFGIKTVKELDENLKQKKELIIALATERLEKGTHQELRKGISIFYMLYCKLVESNNLEFIEKYFEKLSIGTNPARDAEKLISTFKRIKTGC